MAIDIASGSLDWFFQHVPAEALDLDEVFERVLVNRGDERLVFSLGKYGILWKNDRINGEFLGFKETVFQNAFTHIDPETGAVTYREDIQNAQLDEWTSACPSSAGGKDWHSMTYHPPSGLMIAPLSQTCLENAAREVALVQGGGGLAASRKFFEMPGTNGNLGKLGAYNVDTMEEVWNFQQRASYHTGTMSTGGDLVFAGDLDGDSDVDLIFADTQITLLLNDGTGVFTDATQGRMPSVPGASSMKAPKSFTETTLPS